MMKWFMNEESGQGMVEYGLIIALVALLAMGGLKLISTALNKQFGKIGDELGGTGGTGGE